MDSQLAPAASRQLDRFCRQYLQLQLDPQYPDGEYLRNGHFQEELYGVLFAEDAIRRSPPLRYQYRVLKELTRRIEQSIQDWDNEGVSDNLMNYFSTLLVSAVPSELMSVQQKSYVTYTLSAFPSKNQAVPSITLLESRNLLAAAGITGFRTWEAALHLGNYLCVNPDLVKGARVLELGAGTGFTSILATKLGAAHVLSTDGSDDVVASLETNFYLNSDAFMIEAKELKWGHALVGSEHPEWNLGRKVDVVLGADLTYDESWHLPLVATFGDLINLYPEVKIILAATVRNTVTFEKFLATCKRAKFSVEFLDFGIEPASSQDGPFYSDEVTIQICNITRE